MAFSILASSRHTWKLEAQNPYVGRRDAECSGFLERCIYWRTGAMHQDQGRSCGLGAVLEGLDHEMLPSCPKRIGEGVDETFYFCVSHHGGKKPRTPG